MRGLVPRIHVFRASTKAWMAGPSPVMTNQVDFPVTNRAAALPERFRDVEHLEEVMTAPSPSVMEEFGNVSGDLIILGASGKIGTTLARLAKR
ncbi:MAG: hypothetical protein WAN75_26510, partial [Xanthobacteraceae bacterium]